MTLTTLLCYCNVHVTSYEDITIHSKTEPPRFTHLKKLNTTLQTLIHSHASKHMPISCTFTQTTHTRHHNISFTLLYVLPPCTPKNKNSTQPKILHTPHNSFTLPNRPPLVPTHQATSQFNPSPLLLPYSRAPKKLLPVPVKA